MYSLEFWKKLLHQTVAVAAAAAAGVLTPVLMGELDLKTAALAVATAAGVVLLKGVAASYVGDPTSPNFKS